MTSLAPEPTAPVAGAVDVVSLEAQRLAQAAQVHAAQSAMAETSARFAATDAWQGAGIHSFGHWCDVNLGIGSRPAGRLATAAGRLHELPLLQAAFADGALSLDKVLAVAVAVAVPRARSGGARFDLGHTVDGLLH